MADKKYTKLPVIHQTPVIKNFFDTTVEQLFSKANVESMSAYVGRREEDMLDARDTYILQPTADRDKFSLEPAVTSVDQTTGKSTNIMFYEDYVNVLKSYGVNTLNQNAIFDTDAYTFLPPINVDKFINYQEYFWSTAGPTPVIIEGTTASPVNIEKDILGKAQFTTASGIALKSGMVVTFAGNYVIPNKFKNNNRYIVEGVGESIILHNKDQNFATVFSTEDYILFDKTIIDIESDTLIPTRVGGVEFNSGGLAGVENYVSTAGSFPTSDYTFDQTDSDSGNTLWDGYVAPLGSQLVYTVGGAGAFDIEPYDSDNTQENPDYIVMERGAKDNNVWSRINFWHHKNNFLDVGDQLPAKGKRAVRPIIEFDRNIELYNFGTTGKFAVDMSAEGYLQSEIVGRPTGASIDSVTLQPGNTILLASDDASIAQHVYAITDDGAGNVVLTRLADATSPAGVLDGGAGFVPYVAQTGDVVTVKFGSNYQGIEYYWTGVDWQAGQQKTKINTPIKFVMYDGNKVKLDDSAVYPSSTFTGNSIFGYTPAKTNTTEDPVLEIPLEYKNFNNFSEISFTNFVDDYFESYTPFGGTNKKQINGYIYYKKNNDAVTYDTAWRPLEQKLQQRVEDRYIINDSDFDLTRRLYHISAVPTNSESDIAGLVEKSIRIYVNGKRTELFSYDSNQVAIIFASFTFSKYDIIDIFTETETGYFISANTSGRYHVPGSWHSNLDNSDILSISQPEYLEHFKNLIEFQEDHKGDSLGANNSENVKRELKYANMIMQTDDDLQLSAFLLSNDKFNIKDSMDFVAEEYVKYKNRLKKEITSYVNSNDYTALSYGDMLEIVLENVIAYNQGKNVFDDTFMLAFSDKYIEENIVINNVLKREYTLTNYADLLKIENTIYIYESDGVTPDKLLCADIDYEVSTSLGAVTITFKTDYTVTLGNVIKVRLYDSNRESAQVPSTPSALGMYPITYPEIITDTTFINPIKMVVGHDGSKSVATNDVHDFILLEFEKRVYNATLQQFRDNDSLPDLNVADIRPGQFRKTGRDRDEYYGLLRSNFNNYITRNAVDFVKNEFYDESDLWTWNYNADTNKPGYWKGIFEACYDTEKPHTHPWEMLGFHRKPTWWETQYGTSYASTNISLWNDLEDGIIRQGSRENLTNDAYKTNNPYRRIGLKYELPVDSSGTLIAPANIIATSATTKATSWAVTTTGATSNNNGGDTFLAVDGISVAEVSNVLNITTNNVVNHTVGKFPTEQNTNIIADKASTYKLTSLAGQIDPTHASIQYANATTTSNTAIGIATNGALITNANSGITHTDSTTFTYNSMYRNEVSRDNAGGAPDSNNIYGYIQPSPQAVALDSWSTTTHSPIVGWAFDGFPIYGPYGYSDRANAETSIKRIDSSYSLKTVTRSTIGGTPTGEFVEDYEYIANSGDLDAYNGRKGPTPEFPDGTYYYVATVDASNKPAYPYTTGPSFAEAPTNLATNNTGATSVTSTGATYNRVSTLSTVYTVDNTLTNKGWKFGDGAPVENAWKISEGYPFAVMQALLLAQPGTFATVFSDPRKPVRRSANPKQLLDRTTNKRIKTKLTEIHGEVTASETTTYTVGFTQYINAFLKFQGLNTTQEFVKPYRSVTSKLGHKFAGYVDKDTMTVFSDSYSSTGNSSSLILPQEDIDIDVHVGPYSTTNDFTGVLITYTTAGKYKIEGYNAVKRFFEIEESNKAGPQNEVSVGGEPVDYGNFDASANYQTGSVIKSGYNFYRAKAFAGTGSAVTNTEVWQRLPSLPMTNAAEATLYLTGTGVIKKVEYGTVFNTVNEVFDFMVSLGRKQEAMGYDFGEFNGEINDINNWLYSGRQFLFWSIGKWAPGNTLSLSPLASSVRFKAPIGRVSKIIDVDQSQYSILDQEGRSIKTSECEITRDTSVITITPPEGKQIYGVILYTNEIEHAMVLSNKTIFGDTIYDNVLNQRQRRIKIKGKRTAGWNGTLTAEGYIITPEGLKPNFDTLAADMGRYNEIGHVPVEKQVYEASRRQYGYEERKYLREFELTQDDQYDFYAGMIRSKGTKNSIEVLLNSDKVLVPGSVSVYDEWALKAGDFGDTENYQTIDIRVSESDITNERQLIQIAYPEDIVSKVKEVEVLDRKTKFYKRPFLEIEPPPADIPGSFEYGGGTTAKATVNIGTDGRIANVTIDEPGYGYTINPSVTVVAAQLITANITTTFLKPYAVSTANIVVADLTTIGNILITDHFSAPANVNTVIDLRSVTTVEDVANVINSAAGTNANITASFTRTASASTEEFYLTIKGSDFTLDGSGLADLNIQAQRYQPRQRYSFQTANSTVVGDIVAKVDNVTITGAGFVDTNNDDIADTWMPVTHDYKFDEGSRTTITTTSLLSGNVSQQFEFTPLAVSDGVTATAPIATDNLQIINGSYPHIDVEINGVKLPERSEEVLFTITSNVSAGTSTINFLDVGAITGTPIQPNSKIEIIERGTIDLEDTYQGDLPGSSMNIKVTANDALAAKLTQMRTFEIYPDSPDDATILIDVDDPARLPVRPRDMSEKGLWPMTSSVSYVGVVDSKYSPLPNSGYVSKYNVQYQAFDIYDFENLFDVTKLSSATKLPKANDIVHFAKGEHEEFEVYKLTSPGEQIAYVEFDKQVGTSFLWADVKLSDIVLDNNDTANADASYDHTRWFDQVLALKSNSVISPAYKDLVSYEGNPIFVTDQLEVDYPVTRFVSEQKVAEQSVEMGNIQYTVPVVNKISTIAPQLSGNVINAEAVALQHMYQFARAEEITPTTDITIFRSVDVIPSKEIIRGQLTFTINNGQLDGIAQGHWLKFTDTSGSNVHGNIFQVANLTATGDVQLFANSTVLSGMNDTVPKANVSFINFGKTKGNATIDYDVQIVSPGHAFRVGSNVVFDVNNIGGTAGDIFKVKDATASTFTIGSTLYGENSALNVITDTANVSLAETTIKITAVPNTVSTMGDSFDFVASNLLENAGVSIRFKDTSGTELANTSFTPKNIRIEKTNSTNFSVELGELKAYSTPVPGTIANAVVSSTIVDITTSEDIGPGMYLFHSSLSEPVEIATVVYDLGNRGNEPAKEIRSANATTNTITLSSTDGISVGDKVLVRGVLDVYDTANTVTVASISGNDITLSQGITSLTTTIITPEGEPYNSTWDETASANFDILLTDNRSFNSNDTMRFRRLGNGQPKIELKNAITIGVDEVVTFAKATRETLPRTTSSSETEFVVFEINPASYTGGDLTEANLSFTINDGTKITTDTDLTDLVNLEHVKINQLSSAYIFEQARRIDVTSNSFIIHRTLLAEPRLPLTIASDVTAGTSITIVGNTNKLISGMRVSGTGIPADTLITTIDGDTIITLSTAVTLVAGDVIETYRTTYEDATFMSANTVITTAENHGFVEGDTDKIIDGEITVHAFDPDYYNNTFTVVDVPTANTIVIDYPAFAHPYETGGVTYRSKFDYAVYGTDSPGIAGKEGWTPFFIADHLGTLSMNGADVVKSTYPWHSVEQFADEIRDTLYTKAGAVSRKGSMGFTFNYLNLNNLNIDYTQIAKDVAAGKFGPKAAQTVKAAKAKAKRDGKALRRTRPGPKAAPLPKGTTVKNTATAATAPVVTATAGPAPVASSVGAGTQNTLTTTTGTNNSVKNTDAPTLTPKEVAAKALVEALAWQTTNVLPHQQELTKPEAQKYLEQQGTVNGGGLSLGGGGVFNSATGQTDYGQGGSSWGTSEQEYNYATGQWDSVSSGTKWERDGVQFTMQSDGTITASDGTVWATSATRLTKGTMGTLGEGYENYGLTLGGHTPNQATDTPPQQLTGAIAFLGGADIGISHANYNCIDAITHVHEYEAVSKTCSVDENGKNGSGSQVIVSRCIHATDASRGVCDAKEIIEYVDNVASCYKPYANSFTAEWQQDVVNEGATAKFVITAKDVEPGETILVDASGSVNLTADINGGLTTPFTMTFNANGTATKSVTFTADGSTEGAERLKFRLQHKTNKGSITGRPSDIVIVNDTSQDPVPTYTGMSANKSKVGENGEEIIYTLLGKHLSAGATVTATMSGVSRTDFATGGDLTNSMTLVFAMAQIGSTTKWRGTARVITRADVLTEGNETATLTAGATDSNGATAGLVGGSAVSPVGVIIDDTSVSPVPKYERVNYYLYHQSGPSPEYVSFQLAADTSINENLDVFFNMYSAEDRMDVYQGHNKWSQTRTVASTSSNTTCSILTASEKNKFKTLISNATSGSDRAAGAVTSTSDMGGILGGGRKNVGKCNFTYRPGAGRWITVKTTRGVNGSNSSVFYWGLHKAPINKGQATWYFEKSGSKTPGIGQGTGNKTAGSGGGGGAGGGATNVNTIYPLQLGGSGGGGMHGGGMGTVQAAAVPAATPSGSGLTGLTPFQLAQIQGLNLNYIGMNINMVGNGPGLGTKPGVRATGQTNTVKRFSNQESFYKGSITASATSFTNNVQKPTRPLDGRPSFVAADGTFVPKTDSKVPTNDTFNPQSNPEKPKAKYMTIKLLKKNKTGMYAPLIAGGSQVSMNVELEQYCQKPKIKLCASNEWIPNKTGKGTANANGLATDHSQYSIRDGDTFWINNTQISTSGVNSVTEMKVRVQEVMGDSIDATIITDNGVRCLQILMRDNTPDVPILRNGCKGGILKEVLDYTVNNKRNVAFSESTHTAGSRTNTNTVNTRVLADTDSDANTADAEVGSVSTTSTGTDFITNTVGAQQRKDRNQPSTITEGHNGSGYKRGDILRAVGGVSVSNASNPGFANGLGMSIAGLQIARGGYGYGKMDTETGNYQADGSVRITVGGAGQSGYGFEFDADNIQVDPTTGALVGVSFSDGVTTYNGLPAITANNGDKLQGQGYVYNNPPSITIRGGGAEAVATIVWANDTPSLKEEVAVFRVTDVDDTGSIIDLAILHRGLYQTFPGDLNSGVPLEYHVTKSAQALAGGSDFSSISNVSRGVGKGGRVFLTGRLIGDCRQKGTAIQDMGLTEGPQDTGDYVQNLVDFVNDNSTKDPNGFPYFSASLSDDGVLPSITFETDAGDGFELEGSFPGLLESLNIKPGAYIPEMPPTVEVVGGTAAANPDAGGGSDVGNTAGRGGTDADKGIRFKSPNPFVIESKIGDLVASGQLYKYELRRLDGASPINITASDVAAIHVKPFALQSQRISNDLNAVGTVKVDTSTLSNVWVDNYQNTNKWAYLESGIVIRQQEKLVDTKFIRDVFTYDESSAEKEFDVDLYDPFKGILPGFIGKEIDFRTERDPVVYDPRKVKYGRKDVGLRWWDTSTLRYTWYEQGSGVYGSTGYNNYERSQNWGEMFPGSRVVIYEWVESLTAPSLTDNFITETHGDQNGKPRTYYYYWQTNLSFVSDAARVNFQKERSVLDLTRLLQDIDSERVAYTGIVSADALVVNTMGSLIRTDDSILSVNFKRKDTENAQKHTSWTLAGEGDRDGIIPQNLSTKLIDSLAGFNGLDQAVPGTGLSISERYGSKFRPRQTMFKDIKKARKQMFVILNDIFKQLQMETTFLDWRDNLPADYTLLERVNWFEELRIDKINNATVYYDSTYKPLRKVTDTKQFGLLSNVLDKSIIQVQQSASKPYALYEYSKKTDTFKLIAMENETVRWAQQVHSSGQSLTLGKEVRQILTVLYEKVFVNTYSAHWNKFFFEMLKYAYAEQGELDYAFKTTYLKIVKEETDLIPFKGFKIDNFDKAVEYFNEVKPYSSKIRNYSDIKKAPVEILSGSTSDFDRPPFYDEDLKSVRILDNNVPADQVILGTDKNYTGFSSTPDKIRTLAQTIVFDRVKGTFYENTSGGNTQTIVADGTTAIFNLNFTVQDSDRLQIHVNGKKIDKTSTSGGATVTNYAVDVGNSFISFSNDANVNNAVGTPSNGDKIEIRYVDGFDPTLETVNVSIAKNIVAVETASNASISNTSLQWTAPERLWKFNPSVRTAVTNAFDLAYGVGAGSNTSITTNISVVSEMVSSGNLTTALNLVKSKVHATFQGQELDGNIFTDVVPGTHPTTHYTDTRGFDSNSWDDGLFDREVEVNNFVGVFSEDSQGNVNYRVNDETVYGFDSVTFLKSQYGPDRPEELIVVQPLETLVMDVMTQGNTQISTDSTDVRYVIFANLFGDTDYYRRNVEALTTIASNVDVWDNELSVSSVLRLPEASVADSAVIWVGAERIEYTGKDSLNNKLTGVTRGTKGTTPGITLMFDTAGVLIIGNEYTITEVGTTDFTLIGAESNDIGQVFTATGAGSGTGIASRLLPSALILAGTGVYNGEESENIRLRDANGNLIRDPEDFNWIKPVEIFDDTVPFDDDFPADGEDRGSLTGFQDGVMTTDGNVGDLVYSVTNALGSGFDDSWQHDSDTSQYVSSTGSQNPNGQPGGNTNSVLNWPLFDIDEDNGWDSGDKENKEAGSITDKGTVLKSNVSIIDFLHNFE